MPMTSIYPNVVYAEFDTLADFDAYKAHPLYSQITASVRPLRETRIAADFESAAAAFAQSQ